MSFSLTSAITSAAKYISGVTRTNAPSASMRGSTLRTTAASTPGTMSAVLGMEAGAIASAIEGIEGVWIANDNAPGQVVISGTNGGVEAATAALADAGARRVVPLAVAGPFHSPLMAPAADAFADLLRETHFVDARIPVLQNTDPEPTQDAEIIRRRLAAQIVSPVRWTETMRRLAADGPITIIECGPGTVLTGLAKRVENVSAISVQDTGIESILQEVS